MAKLQMTGGAAWSDTEVRRLLKALRRPHRLESVPLARAIAVYYGVGDLLEASRRFVRETFGATGLVDQRLLEILERGDFDAKLPLAAVARSMGLSQRQFFRYRRQAVDALRLRANKLVATLPGSDHVIARI